MTRVAIIYNSEKPKAGTQARRLKTWLRRHDCVGIIVPSSTKKLGAFDFALTLGGDGTMLKASRFLAPARIPVLGINLGTLGFLAETNPDEAYAFLENILKNGFHAEARPMLSVTVMFKHRSVTNTALNDCIIHSGDNGRVITLNTAVNGEFLADYVGDGLIVSTPTGSTAYSLAASGPIVHPHLSVLLLTPICPHTLAQRPMLISDKHELTITVGRHAALQKPVLSLDGQTNYHLHKGDRIIVTIAETPLQLIINPKRRDFEVLRAKLKWGERG